MFRIVASCALAYIAVADTSDARRRLQIQDIFSGLGGLAQGITDAVDPNGPQIGGIFDGVGQFGQGISDAVPKDEDKRRRRRIDGQDVTVDVVCEAALEIARNHAEDLAALLQNPGGSNRAFIDDIAMKIREEASAIGRRQGYEIMNQAAVYAELARSVAPNALKESWIDVYGDVAEQMQACGRVVGAVNRALQSRRLESVQIQGNNIVTGNRRLLSLAGGMAAGAGIILAKVCRSFNPETNKLIPLN